MAVATTTLLAGAAIASAGASVAAGASQAKRGKKMAKQAQQDIEDFQRQDLRNVYAGMALPMEGFRMQEEALAQREAETTGAFARAGGRGLAQLPVMQQQLSQERARLGAQLQDVKFKMQQMIAQDESRMQGMQEQREQQELAGLGAMYQYGQEQRAMGQQAIGRGIGQLASAGAQFAGGFGGGSGSNVSQAGSGVVK